MGGFLLFTFSFVMKSPVAGLAHPTNYLISGIVIMSARQGASRPVVAARCVRVGSERPCIL
jgi:hypothetical protein